MDLIQKANKLGYKHYTEFTVEELDNLSLGNSNKQIEYYFIQKWLRDVHKINLYISYEVIDDSEVAYVWNIIIDIPEGTGRKKDSWDFIKRISSFSEKYMMWYKNYEEALEAGLQEALKLI